MNECLDTFVYVIFGSFSCIFLKTKQKQTFIASGSYFSIAKRYIFYLLTNKTKQNPYDYLFHLISHLFIYF